MGMIVNPYAVNVPAAAVGWDSASAFGTWNLTESNRVATNASAVNLEVGIRLDAAIAASGGTYFELEIIDSAGLYIGVGVTNLSAMTGTWYAESGGYMYYSSNGNLYNNGSNKTSGIGTYGASNIIGICIKNGKIYFSSSGVWTGDPSAETGAPYSGLSGNYRPALYAYKGSESARIILSAADMTYPIPTGCSTMLP